MNIEDKILLNEIKKRNRKVFEALFHEYYPHLLRYAEGFIFEKEACEDIVQSLFIHFWENNPRLSITTSIKAYFYQSVKNRCLNHLRNLQIHDRHKILYMESCLNDDDSSDWEDPEILKKIQEAIALLPDQMAHLLRQRYFEGKKYREIADSNQISENTVKTQLKRAKEKLRENLFKNIFIHFFL